MAEFKKLRVKQFAAIQERETSESKFWRNFSISKEDKHFSGPTNIHFDPTGSGLFIVTASVRVCLYDPVLDKIQRSFSRFQDDAFSGKFRKDGKLLVAGDKAGQIKILDVHSKSIIRWMKGHTAAVRSVSWTADGLHVVSGSDDHSVRYWDLGTGDLLWENKSAHNDYIRTVDASPVDSNLFISGSYDHTVLLWDRRQKTPILSLVHTQPVAQCMFSPSGALVYTASGNEVKVWDILNGGKLIHTFQNHQKNITSICLDGTHTRLLSSGLDGHIKVYNLQAMKYAYGIKCKSPVLSVGLAYDNNKLVVGYVDGHLEIRNKKANTTYQPIGIPVNHLKAKYQAESDMLNLYDNPLDSLLKQAGSRGSAITVGSHSQSQSQMDISRHYKGAGLSADIMTDNTIETERSIRLKSYERFLKKFQYALALDTALKSKNPLIVMMVLEELTRRNGLIIALSSRDELTLEPILSFVTRYVNNPRYAKLLILVTHSILDVYSSMLGHSESIDELFLKLRKQVHLEVGFQKQLLKCCGLLDGIINASLA